MTTRDGRRESFANYRVARDVPNSSDRLGYMVLEDLGPWHIYKTITNDAENVVADLVESRLLHGLDDPITRLRRLFYVDSEGRLDELELRNGQFYRFKPGPVAAIDVERGPERTRRLLELLPVDGFPL